MTLTFLASVLGYVCAISAAAIVSGWLLLRLRALSLAYGAVMAVAAYIFAWLLAEGVSLGFAIPAALLAGWLCTLFLMFALYRVREEAFVIFTFALQLVWQGVALNFSDWTRGALGYPNLPGLPLTQELGSAYAASLWGGAILILALVLVILLDRAPISTFAATFGRSLELAQTLGMIPARTLLVISILTGTIFALSALFASSFARFLGPGSFDLNLSVVLVALALTFRAGAVAFIMAALVLLALPEILRLAALGAGDIAFLRIMLAGAALMVIAPMVLRDSNQAGRHGY